MPKTIISETLRDLCGLADDIGYLSEPIAFHEVHVYDETFLRRQHQQRVANMRAFFRNLKRLGIKH